MAFPQHNPLIKKIKANQAASDYREVLQGDKNYSSTTKDAKSMLAFYIEEQSVICTRWRPIRASLDYIRTPRGGY